MESTTSSEIIGSLPALVVVGGRPSTEAVVLSPPVIDWTRLDPSAQEALRHARAPSTLAAYASDWRQFSFWCARNGRRDLPADPHDVANFLAELGAPPAPKSVSKIQRSASAIAYAHRVAGQAYNSRHPVVLEVLESLRRKLGTAPTNQKRPLVESLVARVCEALGPSLIDVRDRAVVLLGFLSACRASNIVALDVDDATFTDEGVDLVLRRSKTDQTGRGFVVAVPAQLENRLCAARAVRAWIEAACIVDGPLFRAIDRHGRVGDRLTVQDVRRMLRRRIERAGLTLAGSTEFGSHSLRSGFCTSAAEAGRSIEQIMTQTGHKRADSAIRYVRHANRYANNAASGLLRGTG
jgi:integrase